MQISVFLLKKMHCQLLSPLVSCKQECELCHIEAMVQMVDEGMDSRMYLQVGFSQ